jgi:hypothetical protein
MVGIVNTNKHVNADKDFPKYGLSLSYMGFAMYANAHENANASINGQIM